MTTATLGFAIDSSAAVQAKERLEKMSGASMHAENAANSLNAATVRASGGSRTFAQASEMVATAQKRVATATRATTAAMHSQQRAQRVSLNNSRQLSFQLIDIGQALATAPTMGVYALQNLGFQIAQIGQLYMGRGGFTQAIKDSARQVGAFTARVAPLAAVAGTITVGFAGLTYQINRTGKESVSMADVMLASFQLIKEGIYDTIRPAIEAITPWWNRFWERLVANTGEYINGLIGPFVGAYEEIKDAWNGLPAYFGNLGIQSAQAFLDGAAKLAQEALGIYNDLAYKISKKTGITIPSIDAGVYAPQLENPFADSQYRPGEGFMRGMNRDYAGGMFGSIAERAREIAEATEGIGGAAGRAADAWRGLRKTVGDTAEKLRERVEGLGNSLGGIFRGLLDHTMTWKDAAINAIQSVLSFLNQRSLDQTGSGLFGGGFFGSILSGLFGFASGGFTGPGPTHQPAGVVHAGEFVFSKRATDRIGVGNLDRMHRSAKGYASGGYVTANNNMPGAANQNMVVDVRVSVDDDGKLAVVARQVATETVAASAPAITQAAKTETLRSFTGNGEGEKLMRNRFSVKPNTRR